MKRILAPAIALLLALLGVLVLPSAASAAPLPAAYSATAGGDVLGLDLGVLNGVNFAGARVVSTSAASGSTVTPRSSATASDLAATVTGLGLTVNQDRQIAPPDQGGAQTGTLAAASIPGLLTLGAMQTSVEAHYSGDAACVAGNLLADAKISTTAGVTLAPVGLTPILSTGAASTRGVTDLIATTGLNRAVRSRASGQIADVALLGGAVQIAVAGRSTLTATATGVAGGASVDYNPGTVTVTVAGKVVTLAVGATQTFTVAAGAVTVTVNNPTIVESANGQQATGSVSVVTATVSVGSGNLPLASATVDLLPLRASAIAPAGGIDCPPPAPTLVTPANNSSTADTTPTFTGTGTPGASINLTVDGTTITNAAVVDRNGNFTYTPTTPLAPGPHAASATQTVARATSASSNVSTFTVLRDTTAPAAPVITAPADGSTINDTTPDITGTGEPGATVTVSVDGAVIGTDVVDADGNFTVPVTSPLSNAEHTATDTQADAARNVSGADRTTFTVDTVAPAAPVLVNPADGSVATDTTPTFSGTAEAGTDVEVFVDGRSIGTTTANGSGNFTFTPTRDLAQGERAAYAVATDAAGNDSPRSNTNAFTIDSRSPAAPVVTAPADGSTTTDTTPDITGTGEPGATVTISIDGTVIGTDVVDKNGNFTVAVTSPLGNGPHTITGTQTDAAGNKSDTVDVSFAIGAGAPIINPGNGGTLPNTGGPTGWLSLVGALLVLLGGVALSSRRLGSRRLG